MLGNELVFWGLLRDISYRILKNIKHYQNRRNCEVHLNFHIIFRCRNKPFCICCCILIQCWKTTSFLKFSCEVTFNYLEIQYRLTFVAVSNRNANQCNSLCLNWYVQNININGNYAKLQCILYVQFVKSVSRDMQHNVSMFR